MTRPRASSDAAGSAPARRQPNVLVIQTDQYRWDCMGAYGNRQIQTPHLDALAAGGVRYDNSYCSYPVCTPSRYSLLTGLYVHQHFGWGNRSTLPPGLDTFPRALRRAGCFGARDVNRLLGDAGIVRNRLKIEAAIANARATVALRDSARPLSELIWDHAPPARRRVPRGWADVPALSPESTALARELKRSGFRFVGPTTAYALMQACGLVNDHLAGCRVRADVERERTA